MRKALATTSPEDRRLEPLIGYLEGYMANQQAMIEQAARFAREVPARVKIAVVPEVEVGVRDLGALAKIASILVSGTNGRRFLENAAGAFARQTPVRATPAARRATR